MGVDARGTLATIAAVRATESRWLSTLVREVTLQYVSVQVTLAAGTGVAACPDRHALRLFLTRDYLQWVLQARASPMSPCKDKQDDWLVMNCVAVDGS